ncbi:MAG: hypothetical protein R3F49_07655, partial [Planctomycetota bacterium]
MTPRIGRHGAARALIACASLGAVLMVAYVDTERTSPGPIARAHARIAELAEGTSCSACHGGWRTTMTSACLECHAPIAAQIESAGGLHGTLDAQAGRDVVRDPNACGRCHGEHHGDTFALVNARSFALAGVADPAQFDHARIGWAMTGRHAELACTECHTHADAAPLPEGAQRYLGLERSCASCHEDPHEGAFARSCAECHVQTTFAEHVPTGHEKHLPLTGAHGAASCRDCHAEESPHSLEVLAGGGARPPSRGCADCHASPHSAALLEGAARLAGAPRQKSCGACHASEHLAFRSLAATMSVAQHAFTGFNLEAPHTLAEPALAQPAAADSESDPAVGIACAACHDPALESFVERYPGRRPLDCAACHSDPHGGQFRDGAFADADLTGGGCVACHAPAGFAPHTFDLTQHAQAAFTVDGAHAALDCGACHVVPEAAGG